MNFTPSGDGLLTLGGDGTLTLHSLYGDALHSTDLALPPAAKPTDLLPLSSRVLVG